MFAVQLVLPLLFLVEPANTNQNTEIEPVVRIRIQFISITPQEHGLFINGYQPANSNNASYPIGRATDSTIQLVPLGQSPAMRRSQQIIASEFGLLTIGGEGNSPGQFEIALLPDEIVFRNGNDRIDRYTGMNLDDDSAPIAHSFGHMQSTSLNISKGRSGNFEAFQDYTYFEQGADGQLLEKRLAQCQGTSLYFEPTVLSKRLVRLEEMKIVSRRIVGREQALCVLDEYGKPITNKIQLSLAINIRPKQTLLVAYPRSEAHEPLNVALIQVEVENDKPISPALE